MKYETTKELTEESIIFLMRLRTTHEMQIYDFPKRERAFENPRFGTKTCPKMKEFSFQVSKFFMSCPKEQTSRNQSLRGASFNDLEFLVFESTKI
jgi:hypothetical protein